MKLTTKLIIVYLLLTVLLVFGIGGYYLNANLERIRQESVGTAGELSVRIMEQVDQRLKSMDQMAVEVLKDAGYHRGVALLEQGRNAEARQVLRAALNKRYAQASDIRRVVLYDSSGTYISTGLADLAPEQVRQRSRKLLEHYGEIFQKENGKIFLPPQKDLWYENDEGVQVVTEIRALHSAEGEFLGFMEVQQNAMYLTELVERAFAGQKLSLAVIMEETDSVFYRSYRNDALAEQEQALIEVCRADRQIIDTREAILTRTSSNNFYCHTVVLLEKSDLRAYQLSLVSGSVSILLITAAMSVILGVFITRAITRPINDLVEEISKVDLKNLRDEITIPHNSREVSVLVRAFNEMSARVHASMLRHKQHEDYETQAIFKALQKEMGPHFLYNSLGSIADLCESGENEKAADACFDLTDLLRYASVYDVPDVTLEEDLENAKCFMSLMQNRYRQRLTFECETDENALPALLPRMTLQPLLENAIKYSIQQQEVVHIHLKILYVDRLLMIMVADNGVGITKERKKFIEEKIKGFCTFSEDRAQEQAVQFGGIGLIGTLTRLRIYYKESFQYEIRRNKSGGTTIVLYMDRV